VGTERTGPVTDRPNEKAPMTNNTNQDRPGDSDTPPRRYEYLWRNKYLTAEAETLDEMINALQAAVDHLREMRSAGIILDEWSGMADDYAVLVTTDPAIAERFGFEPVTEEDDEEDDEEGEDDAEAEAEGNAPTFDDRSMRRIIIPCFVWTDGEVRPFDGFCRGDGASLPGMSPGQTTVGVFTAGGNYFTILIDTRVHCAVPQFWIEKEAFHFPIVAFATMPAPVDPMTGILTTRSQPAQGSAVVETARSTGSVGPVQAAEPPRAGQ
jgi:hypothetical protein